MKEIFEKVLKYKYISIISIIFLAVFFRFFLIGSVPPGLYPDVAVNGMDAVGAMEDNDYNIFYPANNGREGLYINLLALSFKAFGVGLWQLRFVGAIIGVLSVLGIYLLGKELFNRNVGLFASLFMASSLWAVNFSRIGFRAVMVPLLLVWGSLFIFKGFKEKKPLYYVLSAVMFGLGFHTYIAYKAAVLILVFMFGYKVLLEKGFFKEQWFRVGIFSVTIAIVALPILYYEQTNKGDAARTGQVSVFSEEVNQGSLIKTLAVTTFKGLGMYNFYGDPNARHNYKYLPALNPIVGIAFLIGLFASIRLMLAKLKKRDDEFFDHTFILVAFLIMMLPSILTEEGMPHSLRAIGTMPFAFLFAGLGADRLFSKKRKIKLRKENILAIVVGVIVLFDFTIYFSLWANDRETRGQFNESYVEASKYLNGIPDTTEKYVIVNVGGVEVDGLPVAAQTFKFMTYGKSNVTYLSEEQAEDYRNNFDKDSVIILAKKDEELIDRLNLKCPNGSLYEYNVGEVNEFYIYKVSKFAQTCGGN